ncbi:unnamed protein product [Oikopleura dioica]|uniref:Protein kinase domain-containing protein n=1 Tax=Oikopleura dioica TaxID=34765 RepID=E4YP27_OIKDI|nr:unnamed protein product [Oikopleura dioica]
MSIKLALLDEWMKNFFPKLERESTRTEKCRLIASVERQEFEDDENAVKWRFCKFVGNKGILFDKHQYQLEEFEATSFQKRILRQNPKLKDVLIGRREIRPELGEWKLTNELTIISEGGEAIVFSEKFEETLMAVRVAVFDPFLFTKQCDTQHIKWNATIISDFEKALDKKHDEGFVVPIHENLIRNIVNIEIYEKGDDKIEDCFGWITIMEKCDCDLRKKLKNDNPTLKERKNIATGISAGFNYLEKIGINHHDKKLSNFLLIRGVVKICDFGVVTCNSERKSYSRIMHGYVRSGSKFRNQSTLSAGTPGFTGNEYFTFLFCEWKTAWTLMYLPINEKQRKYIDTIVKDCGVQNIHDEAHVISSIKKVISLENQPIELISDRNLIKTRNMSCNKDVMTRHGSVLDQKSSNLCVPISVTKLLRFAIEKDLGFDVTKNNFTMEQILTTLTMVVYPRSLAGMNLNPDKKEQEFQENDVETLLKRICEKTYLMESGWEIVRNLGSQKPTKSICKFEKVLLNENFIFTRPLTVTGFILFPNKIEPTVHQMTLVRIDNGEYVLENNQITEDFPAVIRIEQTRPYYESYELVDSLCNQTGNNIYVDGNMKMRLVNHNRLVKTVGLMRTNRFYLFPTAYYLTLTKI